MRHATRMTSTPSICSSIILQHTMTHCNTLQHSAKHYHTTAKNIFQKIPARRAATLATHIYTLQQTALHYNTPQNTATTLQHTFQKTSVRPASTSVKHCNTTIPQHTATHYTTVQHSTKHCNNTATTHSKKHTSAPSSHSSAPLSCFVCPPPPPPLSLPA